MTSTNALHHSSPVTELELSRYSHAVAVLHSRRTVARDIATTSAVSSIFSPPKNAIPTTFPLRNLHFVRCRSKKLPPRDGNLPPSTRY